MRAYIDTQNMGAWHKPIPIGQEANVAEARGTLTFRVIEDPAGEMSFKDAEGRVLIGLCEGPQV